MKKAAKLLSVIAAVAVTNIMMYADQTEPEYDRVSKTIAFELEKDYEGCSFTITTGQTGNFEVEMTNSSESYSGNIEDGTDCMINIENAQKGKWNITVTALVEKEADTDETDTETDNQEETSTETELSPDEYIGQIKVSAKAIDKTAFAVGNVKVARDIVGLKYYFIDESIVVEWIDNSCGNVNVSIIDAKTLQILDKQTIKGKQYQFELPELIDEITIDVVPTTSAGIVGANNQFTIPVENNPDATITFENVEYTNRNTISFDAQLNDTYALKMISNGTETETTGLLSAGTYTREIPLNEGNNDVMVYVIDEQGNMRSTSCSVILDSIKPALTLNMEYDGAKTYNEICYIEGTIKDYETFTINEVVPVVSGDGSFKAEYRLNDGNNVVNIRATDKAGNETLYVANIEKVEKEAPNTEMILMIVTGVVILIVVIIRIFKKRNNDDDNEPKKPAQKKEKPVREKGEKKNLLDYFYDLAEWKRNLIECAIVGLIAYFVFANILLHGVIPSGSMEPTLNVGDVALVNGLAYIKSDPQRGDIVILKAEDTGDNTLIKRVIGVPGDSLVFVDGYLYINGELVYEEYLPADMETNSFKDFDEIPENCYFVMGDNRTSSFDSRSWNNPYVPKENIKGKMICNVPVSRLKKAVRSLIAELPF